MADNSGNNSSGPRNWRDRIGVKGDMPKLADEFKGEPTITSENQPQSKQSRQSKPAPARPANKPAAGAAERAASRPVTNLAPMAPRLPSAAARKPSGKSAAQATPADAAATDRSNTFADRLRAQREAAEALAKKRSEETRNRLASGAASSATSSDQGPKFSFAEEEIEAASSENTQNLPAQTRAPQPPRSGSRSEAGSTRPPFRPTEPGTKAATPPPAYQPSDAYRQTHGFREYGENADQATKASQGEGAAHDRYAQGSQEDRSGYAPPDRGEYQVPRTRGPYTDDDDLFEDRPSPARQPGQRADASDYSAAYRDYDEAFDYDDEPKSRGGIWIFVLLMLIVIAAIAGGAYWFINYGTKIGSNTTSDGKVPTVSAPDKPVKAQPNPVDPTTPTAPARRKKIYDRILGNETLEPEKLVPSEETPQTPPAVVPEAAPAGDAPTGIQPLPLPLPPPPTVPGVQGGIQEGVPGATRAGDQKTNRTASVAPGAGKTSQATTTIIAPTAAPQTSTNTETGGQQAPLTLPPVPAPGQTVSPTTPQIIPQAALEQPTSTSTPDAANPPETQTASLSPPPLPRRKPSSVVTRARQEAEQARLAALARASVATAPTVPVAPRQPLAGTGPVQLTPGTTGGQNFNAPVAPTAPIQSNTNTASLQPPQLPASPPTAPTQPATAGAGYVLQMATFRDRNAASAEYRRLISRHGGILRGLRPEIKEGDLGVSGKFYKLRLGAVANRSQASQLCNALIAAGEKDCLVRSR